MLINNKTQHLFVELIKSTYCLQKAMEEKVNISTAWKGWELVCSEWLKYLEINTILTQPYTRINILKMLAKPISTFGIPEILELSGGSDISVINPDTGLLNPFWENYYSELSNEASFEEENVNRIISYINRFPEDDKKIYQSEFIKLRDFISDKDMPTVFTKYSMEETLQPFGGDKDLYRMVSQFYEPIHRNISEVKLCPYCSGILKVKNGQFNCTHLRCKNYIQSYINRGEPFDSKDIGDGNIYVRYTEWVQRFIRIPGFEERKIGEKTKKVFKEVAHSSNVYSLEYNPDFDRVDILVKKSEKPLLQGDVKDVKNPYFLAQSLNKFNIEKKGTLDWIYVIVPNDTFQDWPKQTYIELTSSLLDKGPASFIKVISETEWVKKVRETLEKEEHEDGLE
jgi:hypothetical protein